MFRFLSQLFADTTADAPVRRNVPAVARSATRRTAPPRQPTPPRGIRCPDMLALVAFDEKASVISPFADTFDAGFAASVQKLPDHVRGGLTNIAGGLSRAADLLAAQPRGLLRRVWLLTDGHPNPPDQPIWQAVERLRTLRTNINTIGFADPGGYDRGLLERIARATHNGRFTQASDLAALTATFRGGVRRRRVGSHRGEATVFVIDVSGSMGAPMGGRRRIDAVSAAMIDLVKYKQRTWS